MKKLIILFLFFCNIHFVHSAVVIESVSISEDGSTLTVSGSGFGTKTPAAPLRYEDFESGVNGNAVPSAEATGGLYTVSGVVYDDTYQRFSGAQNLQQNFNNGRYNQTVGLNNADTITSSTLYMHGYWRIVTHGANCRNAKFLNLAQEYGSGNWASRIDADNNSCTTPSIITTLKPGCPQSSGDVNYPGGWATMLGDDGGWHRLESYIDLVGYRSIHVDNTLFDTLSTTDMTDNCSDESIGYVYFGHYYDNGGGCSPTPEAERWWDEIYIDITQARVEISTSATWTGRTHNEIQIPVTWSNTGLTATVNQGSIESLDGSYVYVLDSTGAVNENGYEITIGGESSSTANLTGLKSITGGTLQ